MMRTSEQYLAFERAQADKHEYYAGEIITPAGAIEAHNIILTNINVVMLSTVECQLAIADSYEGVEVTPEDSI